MIQQTFLSAPLAYEYRRLYGTDAYGAPPATIFNGLHYFSDTGVNQVGATQYAQSIAWLEMLEVVQKRTATSDFVIWVFATVNTDYWPSWDVIAWEVDGTTGQILRYLDGVGQSIGTISFVWAKMSRGLQMMTYYHSTITGQNATFLHSVSPDSNSPIGSAVEFDFTKFAGWNKQFICFDIADNVALIVTSTTPASYISVHNFTTGALIRHIPVAGTPRDAHWEDQGRAYVVATTGQITLINWQSGEVYSVTSLKLPTGYNWLTGYDRFLKRMLFLDQTPDDPATGASTLQIKGYRDTPQGLSLTKPVPLARSYVGQRTAVMARLFGEIGEAVGGPNITAQLSNANGTLLNQVSATDGFGYAHFEIDCNLTGDDLLTLNAIDASTPFTIPTFTEDVTISISEPIVTGTTYTITLPDYSSYTYVATASDTTAADVASGIASTITSGGGSATSSGGVVVVSGQPVGGSTSVTTDSTQYAGFITLNGAFPAGARYAVEIRGEPTYGYTIPANGMTPQQVAQGLAAVITAGNRYVASVYAPGTTSNRAAIGLVGPAYTSKDILLTPNGAAGNYIYPGLAEWMPTPYSINPNYAPTADTQLGPWKMLQWLKPGRWGLTALPNRVLAYFGREVWSLDTATGHWYANGNDSMAENLIGVDTPFLINGVLHSASWDGDYLWDDTFNPNGLSGARWSETVQPVTRTSLVSNGYGLRLYHQGVLFFINLSSERASYVDTNVPPVYTTRSAKLDYTTRAYSLLAATPFTATDCAGCAHDGKIYVFGGFDTGIGYVATTWVYTIATDSWAAGPAVPRAGAFGDAVSVGEYIYLMFGGGPHNDYDPRSALLYRLHPATGVWKRMAPMTKVYAPIDTDGVIFDNNAPFTTWSSPKMTVADGKLYFISDDQTLISGSYYKSLVWEYNPALDPAL